MIPTGTTHPSQPDLAAFAVGKLSGPEADAVAKHLRGCADCRGFIEGTPNDSLIQLLKPVAKSTYSVAVANTASMAGTATPAAGSLVVPPELANHPKYKVLKPLGQGGMGAVFLAEDTQLGRRVALKVIGRAMLTDPDAVARFEQEAKTSAQLIHPNVAVTFAVEAAGEVKMLAMEYIEGVSLDKLVAAKGPLPVRNACHFARQAALALQAAHEKKMVHRDIKPANLMVTKTGQVKVLDFGLAKVRSEAENGAGLTAQNMVMGTAEYLAPEQAMNAAGAQIQADIYSLGCTLYHLLTGHPPFAGGSIMSILLRHREEIPQPVVQQRPDVPAELSALVDWMLAKNPADRPQTPKEVAAALMPFLKVPASSAPPLSRKNAPRQLDGSVMDLDETLPAEPARSLRKRKPWLIWGGIGAAALGLVVIVAVISTVVILLRNRAKTAAADDGFVSLFNGKDLTGWVVGEKTQPVGGMPGGVMMPGGAGPPGMGPQGGMGGPGRGGPGQPGGPPAKADNKSEKPWRVENGEIVATSANSLEATTLRSARQYRSYRLKFQFQTEAGAFCSFIPRFLESDGPVQGAVLLADDQHFSSPRPGIMGPGPGNGNDWLRTGALQWSHDGPTCVAPEKPAKLADARSWNDVEVELSGQLLTVLVNGAPVLSRVDLAEVAERGNAYAGLKQTNAPIALASNTGTVRFRNIRIQELPSPQQPAKPPTPILAPEQSEWAGLGVYRNENGEYRAGGTCTIVERRGNRFKAMMRSGGGGKSCVEGTIDSNGHLTIESREPLLPEARPREVVTGRGEVTTTRITYSMEVPGTSVSAQLELKRLPDGGAGFDLQGRWKCFHRPSGWTGFRQVNGDRHLTERRADDGAWERDGGLLIIHFPGNGREWLIIDPDNPNELNGGGGDQAVTWIRQ
ncbi:MAG: protein kinase domain-containing protein [Gemmataceae bacterium]